MSGTPSLPYPPEVRTVERWVVAVIRQDGAVEVLGDLFHTQLEAEHAAEWHRREWRGVTVQAAQCTVIVNLGDAHGQA